MKTRTTLIVGLFVGLVLGGGGGFWMAASLDPSPDPALEVAEAASPPPLPAIQPEYALLLQEAFELGCRRFVERQGPLTGAGQRITTSPNPDPEAVHGWLLETGAEYVYALNILYHTYGPGDIDPVWLEAAHTVWREQFTRDPEFDEQEVGIGVEGIYVGMALVRPRE